MMLDFVIFSLLVTRYFVGLVDEIWTALGLAFTETASAFGACF